jgi:two-component system, chemotaxis family, protein-glutamate methylesterase/glutaminase
MGIKKKIRVLIVDDSLLFREALVSGLSKDFGLEIVGTAEDAFEAKDKIIALRPDVMTLDIEMPKMSGIEFLQRLLPQCPIPVVVVSAVGDRVFDALKAGAVDFVSKSDIVNHHNVDGQFNELIVKLKIASTAKVGYLKHENSFAPDFFPHPAISAVSSEIADRVIGIGASTGGTEAVAHILKQLGSNIPGTLIVQHMPPVFTRMYADRLNNSCAMEVKEAQNGDRVLPGRVLIAPGDHQMRLKKVPGGFIVQCQEGEKVNGHCPSVGVLFDSLAKYGGKNAIGVILTGMGSDGAEGLLQMRKCGARTIGQDEESSVVYGMPKVAYQLGAVEAQVSLSNIPLTIHEMLKGK